MSFIWRHLKTPTLQLSVSKMLTNCTMFILGQLFCIHPPLLSSRFSNNNAKMDASVLYKEERASKNSFEHKVCLYFDANFPWA